MIFDSKKLAVGWLSIATASSNDKTRPALNRTVLVEQFGHGIRLVSTDSYMLLHCWIPSEGNELEPEPRFEEAPDAVAVVMDIDHRGRGLLHYAKQLWDRADKVSSDDIPRSVRLDLNVRDLAAEAHVFDGMAARFAVLVLDDHEKVQLQVYEGEYPNWRALIDSHKPDLSRHVALSGDMLKRLSKVAALHSDAALIGCTFAGPDKPVHVQVINGEPFVEGLAMPCRWDIDNNRPAAPDGATEAEAA